MEPGGSFSTGIDGGLTHFVKAGEAGGHGRVFGGLAQIRSTGRPHFASLAQRF